jgi:SPIRAL1-like protein
MPDQTLNQTKDCQMCPLSPSILLHAGASTADVRHGSLANNYSRPGGQQNVGNFLTDKPSSRVLAPPGGGSQIQFGNYHDPYVPQKSPAPAAHGGYNQSVSQYQSPLQHQQQPHAYGGYAGGYGGATARTI